MYINMSPPNQENPTGEPFREFVCVGIFETSPSRHVQFMHSTLVGEDGGGVRGSNLLLRFPYTYGTREGIVPGAFGAGPLGDFRLRSTPRLFLQGDSSYFLRGNLPVAVSLVN